MVHVADYAVFSLLTGASLSVGGYFSIRRKPGLVDTTDEVFLGSKSLRILPLAASVLATVGSATGIIGMPSHMYAYGLHLGWLSVSNLILIPLAVFVVVPVLYELNITSVFQYVRMRYNLTVSVITSLTYIALSHMIGAIAIYASAVAVSTVFNLSTIWCSITIGLAATAYTSLGGLRGVVWADCLQAVLTLSAPVLIICKVVFDASNGDDRIQPLAELDLRKYLFNISADVTTEENVWSILIGSAPIFISRICMDQGTAQRYLASRTLQEAKLIVVAGTLMSCLYYACMAGTGLALTLRYKGCDPYLAGLIRGPDQLLPFYILEECRSLPGFPGIFLAGVVSASISTVSSIVNSQAAVWYFDVVTPFLNVPSKRVSCIIKALAFAVGAVMTAISVVVPYLGSAVSMFIAVSSAITGPFVGLLLLGLTVPFANSKGAGIVTLLMVAYQMVHLFYRLQSGVRERRMPVSLDYCRHNATNTILVSNVTLSVPSERPQSGTFPLFDVSPFWSSFFTTIATYVGGLVASVALGGKTLSVTATSNLTSPALFPLWQRLGCMQSKQRTPPHSATQKELPGMADPSEQAALFGENVI
ncbi:sodium-coupled monocarboxylate transporter 1-like [Amblyomma americanum]